MLAIAVLAVAAATVALPVIGATRLTEWIYRRCDPYDF